MSIESSRQAQIEQEEADKSWSQKVLTRFSGKSDQHYFITAIIGDKNKELYKQPHMLNLYSNSFK